MWRASFALPLFPRIASSNLCGALRLAFVTAESIKELIVHSLFCYVLQGKHRSSFLPPEFRLGANPSSFDASRLSERMLLSREDS
jgi:hypothetical protein